MIKFIVIILFMIFLMVFNTNRKNSLYTPSTCILFIYLLIALFAPLDIVINNKSSVLNSKYIEGSFVYMVNIFIYLFPFLFFKENKIRYLIFPNMKLLNIISAIFIFLSIGSIIYYIPYIYKNFTADTVLNIRSNVAAGNSYLEDGFFNRFFLFVSSFYILNLILCFVYLIKRNHTKRTILLFLSSFSYVANSLAFIGRDGFVFWFFSSIFCYFFFKPFLNYDNRMKIKKCINFFLILFSVVFMYITIGRWGNEGKFNNDVFKVLVSYIGQPIPNYCLFYGLESPPRFDGASFPLFYKILGLQSKEGIMWEINEVNSWTFGTFLKSIGVSLGLVGTFILGVFSCIIFSLHFRVKRKNYYMNDFFLYVMYFTILSQGCFYYKQYGNAGNLYIIVSFVLYYLFKNKIFTNFNPVILRKL